MSQDEREPQEPWPADRTASTGAFLLRYAGPGMVGALLLAIGAVGVGWLPPLYNFDAYPLIADLRGNVGSWVARAMVIAGGALLLQAWLILGLEVMRGAVRDVRRLWAVLALWCVPLLLAPPLFSRDVYSYFVQGKLFVSGLDPYSTGVGVLPGWFQDGVDPQWILTPAPYGPLWLSLSRGVVALVGDNAFLGTLAFRGLALCGVALMAYYVPRLAFHCGIDGARALWLGVLNPLVLLLFVVSEHNDALMVGLMIAGLALVAERRPVLGILLITAAIAIKPIAMVALPFAGLLWAGASSDLRKRILRWVQTAAIAVAAFLGISAVIGTGYGWLAALSGPSTYTTWLSPPTALGMIVGGLGNHFGLGDHTDGALQVTRALGLVIGGLVIAWLCLKPEGRTPIRGLALAFLAIVLLGPTFQTWYLLWVLTLFAVSGLTALGLRVVLLLIAGATVYTLCETSATRGPYFGWNDGLAMVLTVVVIALAIFTSRRERLLLLGDPVSHGLLPADPPSQARHDRLVMRPASGS